MKKKCFKCNQTLPIDDFYKHSEMSDGHLNKCKECTKKDARENYRTNWEKYQKYEKFRNKLPERIAFIRKQNKKHRKENPEKYKARNKLNNAIRDGKMTKENQCEKCGSDYFINAHHDNYASALEVRWLCKKCHSKIHNELKV